LPPSRPGASGALSTKNGKMVLESKFEKAGSFREGLCPVRSNSKWGFINRFGIFVIPPQFDQADHFTNDLAAITTGGTNKYIDHRNIVIWNSGLCPS
jgi:hypothetical protein